ncbi:hypothetical protein CY652_06795 [Burkholderia sp. WAC0059]|uniref:hypothetical protein n=1 Tax=Burkholderia sp. WAC0059 TaxID=2066022 RepID=UPI000C7EE8A1|nr:hypothetical protein [Burkholderia sp. WAC0059]PLZ03021.1 hypothetical protein CY652_06795 [Burkholderia sp. WAC0059]
MPSVRVAALLACAVSASAAWGAPPLVLDTQHGISGGSGGTILQTAPLSSAPMVQMQSLPGPSGSGGNTAAQQPIIVSPYIRTPGGAQSMGAGASGTRFPPSTVMGTSSSGFSRQFSPNVPTPTQQP